MSKQENKEVKSYSLPPYQIEWLRKQALDKSTPQKTVSASSVLEVIIDEAMNRNATQLSLLVETKAKKNAHANPAAAEPLSA